MSSAIPEEPPAGLTRRDALIAGGTAALAGVLWSPSFVRAGGSVFSRATYTALMDRRFPAYPLAGGVRHMVTRLVAIEDLPRARTLAKYRGADNAFSLVFEGQLARPGGIYKVSNAELGRTYQLFLAPVGPPGRTQLYEAVIDRMYRPTATFPAPTPDA